MAKSLPSKKIVGPSEAERKLALYFLIAAALSVGAILWNFAPLYRLGSTINPGTWPVSGFHIAFDGQDSYHTPFQWIYLALVALSAILALYIAFKAYNGERLAKRGFWVALNLSLDGLAVLMLYFSWQFFATINVLDAINERFVIGWGYVLVALFTLASIFIKWFFLFRLRKE